MGNLEKTKTRLPNFNHQYPSRRPFTVLHTHRAERQSIPEDASGQYAIIGIFGYQDGRSQLRLFLLFNLLATLCVLSLSLHMLGRTYSSYLKVCFRESYKHCYPEVVFTRINDVLKPYSSKIYFQLLFFNR